MSVLLRSDDLLLVIDVQVDFLPGGALPVVGGDRIIPKIQAIGARFEHVVLTQDWHPPGHISFASAHPGKRSFTDTIQADYGPQTLWPDHCVQGTAGAQVHPELEILHAELILRKGFRRDIDSYSAFTENDGRTATGLAGYLRERDFNRLFFAGLAFDYCVGFSALEASRLGFEAVVLEDLTRAIDLDGSVVNTRKRFAAAGVQVINADNLV